MENYGAVLLLISAALGLAQAKVLCLSMYWSLDCSSQGSSTGWKVWLLSVLVKAGIVILTRQKTWWYTSILFTNGYCVIAVSMYNPWLFGGISRVKNWP